MGELLEQILTQYAVNKSFSVAGLEIRTVFLVYAYVITAGIAVVYATISVVLGSVGELFGVGDGDFLPASAIGMGIFSIAGATSLLFWGASPRASLVIGLGVGVAAFAVAIAVLKSLTRFETNSTLTEKSLVDLIGTCNLRIKPGTVGEVIVSVNGRNELLRAFSDQNIDTNQKIRIVDTRSAREVDVEPA